MKIWFPKERTLKKYKISFVFSGYITKRTVIPIKDYYRHKALENAIRIFNQRFPNAVNIKYCIFTY